jgi:hypothetical protein
MDIRKYNALAFELIISLLELFIAFELIYIVLPYFVHINNINFVIFMVLFIVLIMLLEIHSNIVNKFKAWNMRFNNAKTEH